MDAEDFKARIELRSLLLEDFDAVVALQRRSFPQELPVWTRAQYESQIRVFPEGQLGIFYDGELVASASSLIVDYSDYSNWSNWFEMCDHGFIGNHDPEGDTLYGIEIMVDPDMRGMKLARRLYDARKELCQERNLARMIIGGRIPGYVDHKEGMSPKQYVERVMEGALYDPVLTAQLANGFRLRELVPDYLPSDEDSAGWATCLEWPNLDHQSARTHRTRRTIAPVRVASVQYQMRAISGWDDFTRQAEFFVDTASDHKSDFVVFPELFTLQLLSLVSGHGPGQAARKLADFTPRFVEFFRDLAIRYNVNTVAGSQFVLEDDRLLNCSYLFKRDGTLGRQTKIHVTPNEGRWWGVHGGDKVEVFDTDRGRVAILICYDIEFPELARIAAKKGAQMVFVPFNTSDRNGYLRVSCCARARAIENQMYVITSGCVGNLPSVENADTHYASSAIYTPCDVAFARDGIAGEASPNIEMVITQDLDTELVRRARRAGTVRNWTDRRTDLYRVRWREGTDETET